MIFKILLLISGLFFALLLIKSLLKKEFCVLCFSVSSAWIFLLILYYLEIFDNLIIISILIGSTILGIFYTAERKFKKNLKIFRLPFFLTLILAGYYFLTFENISGSLFFLAVLWILFFVIYLFKENKSFGVFADKIIECCKRW